MIKEKRFDFILKEVEKQEQISYEYLARLLNISVDTVRRDIEHLSRNGLLSKVRGGAVLRSKNPLNFQDRTSYMTEEKNIIALKTQQFFKEGMTVFMDGGTTLCTVAKYFPTQLKTRVVTNSQPLISILSQYANVEIIALGGLYDRETATFTGQVTCMEASRYVADLYLMGTCGVDPGYGVTAAVRSDSEVKRVMKANAFTTVSLVSDSRLGHRETFKVCDFTDIEVLVTNLPSDSSALENFRNRGVRLI